VYFKNILTQYILFFADIEACIIV